MKGITLNLPQCASILGALQASGFEADVVARYIFDEFAGKASHDIPNALITEFQDIALNFIENPSQFAMDFGIGYLKPYVTFKVLGMGIGALGFKKSVRVGKVTIKFAS